MGNLTCEASTRPKLDLSKQKLAHRSLIVSKRHPIEDQRTLQVTLFEQVEKHPSMSPKI